MSVCFTGLFGIKDAVISYCEWYFTVQSGNDIITQFFNFYHFTVSQGITVILYWLFLLSLCFQIAYKTAKKITNVQIEDSPIVSSFKWNISTNIEITPQTKISYGKYWRNSKDSCGFFCITPVKGTSRKYRIKQSISKPKTVKAARYSMIDEKI